jgi:mannose-6-phosphate isomerase
MIPAGTALFPLLLRARLHATIWGGQNLARYAGKAVPPNATIGESWETELHNQVLTSFAAGTSLSDLVSELGEALLGSQALRVFGPRFPLLAKFIDAQDKLSVQVHPDDDDARQHEGGKLGKTEAWYILHADPGAAIIHGFKRATTRAEVQQSISEKRLEALLHEEPVQAGDVIFVPAGTVHAIGPGIILYELQEYSDLTYRLYDYGRLTPEGTPRELHIERALDVLHYEPSAIHKLRPLVLGSPLAPGSPGENASAAGHRCLAACRYFVLEELTIQGPLAAATSPSSCQIVTVLEGRCQLLSAQGAPLELTTGATVVLPARLGDYQLEGAARLLRSYVPTPDDDLLRRFWSAQ